MPLKSFRTNCRILVVWAAFVFLKKVLFPWVSDSVVYVLYSVGFIIFLINIIKATKCLRFLDDESRTCPIAWGIRWLRICSSAIVIKNLIPLAFLFIPIPADFKLLFSIVEVVVIFVFVFSYLKWEWNLRREGR